MKMNNCMNLLKNNEVSGVFSAGSTGAAMVAAITILGKVKGISRPAIASVLPGYRRNIILLDLTPTNTQITFYIHIRKPHSKS